MTTKFAPWWNETITIYNKLKNDTTKKISWHKTVLNNCFWGRSKDIVISKDAISKSNDNVVRIPLGALFSVQPEDIILKGSIDEEIDEYTEGKRSSDILAKYRNSGAFLVKKLTDNSDPAKLLPHYLVSGV